jgi:hypothetical protein
MHAIFNLRDTEVGMSTRELMASTIIKLVGNMQGFVLI